MQSAPLYLPCFSSGRKAGIAGEDGVDSDGTIQNLRRSRTVPSMLRHLQSWDMQTPVGCCVGKEWSRIKMTMDGMERVVTFGSKQLWSPCCRYISSWEMLTYQCSCAGAPSFLCGGVPRSRRQATHSLGVSMYAVFLTWLIGSQKIAVFTSAVLCPEFRFPWATFHTFNAYHRIC